MANSGNGTPAKIGHFFKSARGIVTGGAILGGTTGALVAPAATTAILANLGFSSIGPVAGTLAAAVQSSIGAVAAGSPFAVAQSIAMGGAAASIPPIIGALVGAGLTALAVYFLMKYLRAPGKDGKTPLQKIRGWLSLNSERITRQLAGRRRALRLD